MRLQSLRSRLTVIILAPLMLISLAAAVWQFRNAALRAEEIFDRGLLSAAISIARDMAVSGGDALTPSTRQLISDTSGGELFYHVYAPDGVFVTGYATPPPAPPGTALILDEPLYYDGRYQGKVVRVLRFQDAMSVEGLTGLFNITVWQNMSVREGFVHGVVLRSFGVIALLVLSVALVVWFGVGLGLRPLLDLQAAIARRNPSELEPIQRPVPVEIRGIVATLNTLLDRVSRRISSKDEFIANAAHQLRNPIAGVLALAEAVKHAPSNEDAHARGTELVDAARDLSHLTNQLLSFERAGGSDTALDLPILCLNDIVNDVVNRFRSDLKGDISIAVIENDGKAYVRGDPIMLREALTNLLGNALLHGGPKLSAVEVAVTVTADQVLLTVSDDGIGIDPGDRDTAISRFSQVTVGPGSGLGLPIAARVAENHGGALNILDVANGASIRMDLPLAGNADGPINNQNAQRTSQTS